MKLYLLKNRFEYDDDEDEEIAPRFCENNQLFKNY